MSLTVVGVRHHSPACARLVAGTIAALRPAYVLIEGPADMNERIDELLLDHHLPVAVFTSYTDERRRHSSWAPFCAYSPEWAALTAGRAAGAGLRFIDLPAWHEAFAERGNRYADAELRYADAVERLCAAFDVDNPDALWDHVVEIAPADGLAERLAAYFDLVRGESAAGPSDTAREDYMAGWIRAALAEAGDRPVVAVVGGFHRPALLRLHAEASAAEASAAEADVAEAGVAEDGAGGWPVVPSPAVGAITGSYLVPYSFRRLDAFAGYQSGMPSPEYYQRLWDDGPQAAARYLVTAVAGRLRDRGQPVSTADLIAARACAEALALVRGHHAPARVDVLDGLAGALINEALDVPLPWAVRGPIRAGQHPAVVEMTAALSGDRVGRLHPDTPLPPLVHTAAAELAAHGLDQTGELTLDLTTVPGRDRSRVLHRLRVLGVPGYTRTGGPSTGLDPVLHESWTVREHEHRLVALIEAAGYGSTLQSAAAGRLAERITAASGDLTGLAGALFDAALCGVADLTGDVLADLERGVAASGDLAGLGRVLSVTLALWRHDRLWGTAGSPVSTAVVAAATRRILWVIEGLHGAGQPADLTRIRAVVAVRDALLHAAGAAALDRDVARATAARVAADPDAPPELRGAAYGLGRVLRQVAQAAQAGGSTVEPVAADDSERAVRGAFAAASAGDWLAGLFGVAREEVLAADGVLALLDELVSGFGADEFLIALPALRQAFEFFPPREREILAGRLLARRGSTASGRDLLRTTVAPEVVAAGLVLDERIEALLVAEGLLTPEVST
ncbi:DUF5682 family protein [Micromonosporaceae bacterium Da 78-11]